MKRCNVCGEEKPVSEFYKHGKYVSQPCKACSKNASKLRWQAEKERKRKLAERASKLAADKHMRRKMAKDGELVCRNCWLYPCFKGIDTMSSNLAETCISCHLRGKS